MKRLFLITLTIISFDLFGQSADNSKTILTLRHLDSLYRQIPNFKEVLLRVHYNPGTRLDLYYPSPDTLIAPKHIGFFLKDSIKLEQYCKSLNINYNVMFDLFKILISNKYIGININGLKECKGCSTDIFFKDGRNTAYYVIKDTKHPCFQNACFMELNKDLKNSVWTINDLTKDIVLIKKRN